MPAPTPRARDLGRALVRAAVQLPDVVLELRAVLRQLARLAAREGELTLLLQELAGLLARSAGTRQKSGRQAESETPRRARRF